MLRQALRKIADITAVANSPQHIDARKLIAIYDIALFALAEDEREEDDVSAGS